MDSGFFAQCMNVIVTIIEIDNQIKCGAVLHNLNKIFCLIFRLDLIFLADVLYIIFHYLLH